MAEDKNDQVESAEAAGAALPNDGASQAALPADLDAFTAALEDALIKTEARIADLLVPVVERIDALEEAFTKIESSSNETLAARLTRLEMQVKHFV